MLKRLTDNIRLFFIEGKNIPDDFCFHCLLYLLGSLTCFVAVIAIFVLPDFPSNSESWLSPLEKKLAEKRMTEDAGVSDEVEKTGSRAILLSVFTDWKVWYMGVTLSYFPCQVVRH